MKIKNIEIVFDNCDFIKIPLNFINYCFLTGIKDNKIITNDGDVLTPKRCEEVKLGFKKEALALKSNEGTTFLSYINAKEISSVEGLFVPVNQLSLNSGRGNPLQKNKLIREGVEITIKGKK